MKTRTKILSVIGLLTVFCTTGTVAATSLKNAAAEGESISFVGASVRMVAESSGLRFQTKVSESLNVEGNTFGTLIIPKDVLGVETLDHNTEEETLDYLDVAQTKWATTVDPEDGMLYFNAALVGIPATAD